MKKIIIIAGACAVGAAGVAAAVFFLKKRTA